MLATGVSWWQNIRKFEKNITGLPDFLANFCCSTHRLCPISTQFQAMKIGNFKDPPLFFFFFLFWLCVWARDRILAILSSKYAKLFQKKKKESWDGKLGSVSPVQQILAQKNLADPHEPWWPMFFQGIFVYSQNGNHS